MKTVYAIPGLGTTEGLFSMLKLSNCKLVVLKWPETQKGMSIKDYAQEFIKQIDTSEKFYLMGVSLGGMICSELSHLLKAEKVFLISSCKNKLELPPLIKALKYLPLHKLLSENTLRKFAFHSRWLLGFEKEYEDEFVAMIQSMPKNYVKHTISMIVNWDKTSSPLNCVHLHGTKDRLLLFKNVKADHVIENGTHAMIVYQATEISKLLNELMR